VSAAIPDWLRLLLPSPGDGAVSVITAYFDDTGTHVGSPVVGFGGLFGDAGAWKDFDERWRAKLQAPLRGKDALRRFHMADCMAREDEFRGYSEGERDAIIHDFRQIIIESGVWGYAMLASQADWAEVVPNEYQQIIGDAEAYCFRDVVGRMIGFIDRHSADADLALVFDNRPEKEESNNAIYRQFQGLAVRTQLAGIFFLENRKFSPLQGADMWAWEVFNQASASIREGRAVDPRPHAKQYHESGRFEAHWCDRTSIQRVAETLRWALPK
jgi:hypothetical protein